MQQQEGSLDQRPAEPERHAAGGQGRGRPSAICSAMAATGRPNTAESPGVVTGDGLGSAKTGIRMA